MEPTLFLLMLLKLDEDLEYVAHDLLHRGFDPKWNMDLEMDQSYPKLDLTDMIYQDEETHQIMVGKVHNMV